MSDPADTTATMTAPPPELCANATVLNFEPGLYAMTFHATAPVAAILAPGLVQGTGEQPALPCARLESIAGHAGEAHVTVATLPAGGWIDRNTRSAHVLVTHPGAAAMLTIYRASDMAPMPEVRFTPIVSLAASDAGEWLGDPDGREPLEGFSIALPPGTVAGDFEYQGIMGYSWRTPWVAGGEFCGSRDVRLALLGFQIRLRGPAADRLVCRAWGQFEGTSLVGPVGSGEDCFANGAALLAMKVSIQPRADAANA